MVLIRKNGLWRVYATRWVGLGLWGRCISYVRENCVSYARQQISYHMHVKIAYYMHAKHVRIIWTPKSILRISTTSFHFYLQYYLCIFMRPGSFGSCFDETPPSEIQNVLRLVSWPSALWLVNRVFQKWHAPYHNYFFVFSSIAQPGLAFFYCVFCSQELFKWVTLWCHYIQKKHAVVQTSCLL